MARDMGASACEGGWRHPTAAGPRRPCGVAPEASLRSVALPGRLGGDAEEVLLAAEVEVVAGEHRAGAGPLQFVGRHPLELAAGLEHHRLAASVQHVEQAAG